MLELGVLVMIVLLGVIAVLLAVLIRNSSLHTEAILRNIRGPSPACYYPKPDRVDD